MVNSSILPSPHTTRVRCIPNRTSTSARIVVSSLAKTPVSCTFAPAGLVSGPRILKMVRIPISRRGLIAYFIARWSMGAKRNPIPTVLTHRPTASALMDRSTPSASRTSALPQLDETALLPCLATGIPAAATTKLVVVETLKLPEPSPPVPTISINNFPELVSTPVSTKVALSRITLTAPTISSMVSPFIRSAVMKLPIWASVASPPIISFITMIISCSERSILSTVLLIAFFIIA